MKHLIAIVTLILAITTSAHAVDLREYFPSAASSVIKLNTMTGADNTRYTFMNAPSGYAPLYNTFLSTGKPGYHYAWQKEYFNGSSWCIPTVGILFMADDKSVTEAGDWLSSGGGCTPNTVFGYKSAATNGTNKGLVWSPIGGLTSAPAIAEMFTAAQNTPGAAYVTNGYGAYSKTGLIEELPTYKPPYGRDANGNWCAGCAKTYTDVIRIVMYHGTKAPTPVPVRCETTSPVSASGAYYQSYKNYNSYAIELWLAKGKGIIQENTPYIEDATYWGLSNCTGGIFTSPHVWSKFIDEM